jgi:beta-phosphoglucomutase
MKLPLSTKYLLFDMDGTLVDTEPVGPQNFVNQLKKHGKKPTKEECELFSKIWRRDGTNIKQDDWLPVIAAEYGIDIGAEAYLKEFYEMYVQAVIAAPALPGVDDFLKLARSNDRFGIALVTASKRQQVDAIIQQHAWGDIFDQVVTSEDITKFKPDPESFIVGMRKLSAEPSVSVVFEDSKNGANAGRAAGCYVVGLRVGNAKLQDLSNTDIGVDSFKDVSLA